MKRMPNVVPSLLILLGLTLTGCGIRIVPQKNSEIPLSTIEIEESSPAEIESGTETEESLPLIYFKNRIFSYSNGSINQLSDIFYEAGEIAAEEKDVVPDVNFHASNVAVGTKIYATDLTESIIYAEIGNACYAQFMSLPGTELKDVTHAEGETYCEEWQSHGTFFYRAYLGDRMDFIGFTGAGPSILYTESEKVYEKMLTIPDDTEVILFCKSLEYDGFAQTYPKTITLVDIVESSDGLTDYETTVTQQKIYLEALGWKFE